MRDNKVRRAAQGRSLDEAAKKGGASRSSIYPLKGPTAEASAEDDLTRLIREIARQAAREAFDVFRDALAAGAVKDLPPLDRPTGVQALEGQPENESGSPEPAERFLSVGEVAKRLGVSEKTVRRKISSGDWPARRVGKLIRVSERALSAQFVSVNPKPKPASP
jgi:excisionase family DNA binding protein